MNKKVKNMDNDPYVYFAVRPKCSKCDFVSHCNRQCFESSKRFAFSEGFKRFAKAYFDLKGVDSVVLKRKNYNLEVSLGKEIKDCEICE